MRYVEARLNESNREEAYRIYVTKSLQLIPQSKYLKNDYVDLLDTKPQETRSGDEIVIDIMSRAGLKFGE